MENTLQAVANTDAEKSDFFTPKNRIFECCGNRIFQRCFVLGERAKRLIGLIDEELILINDGLYRAQPPYSGKLQIRFKDEGAEDRRPIVVKLVTTRKGDFMPMEVPSLRLAQRAPYRSSFAINHVQVRKMLERAEVLLKKRKEINNRLRIFSLWEESFSRSVESFLEDGPEVIGQIRDEVEQNLMERPTRARKEAIRKEKGIVRVRVENRDSLKAKHKREGRRGLAQK